jgi:hypothetical protein
MIPASALTLVLLASIARATTLSGYLDDPGNANLIGSDLGTPLFTDDFEIANNVALYALLVPTAATVTFDSNGFDAGGVDPYFTLFQGSTPATAIFFESNYDQAFSTGGDFLISLVLPAGDYFVALGAFANMSFAENLGIGTLDDGFIGLGVPDPILLGSYYYELDIASSSVAPVPEPSSSLLLVAALVALARYSASRRRHS